MSRRSRICLGIVVCPLLVSVASVVMAISIFLTLLIIVRRLPRCNRTLRVSWRIGDLGNPVGFVPGGQAHGHLSLERLAQQCAGERGVHADPARFLVELVRAHDAVNAALARGRFQRDAGAKEDPAQIARRLIHHHHALETLAQVAHARVDFPQPALAVGVLRVFRAIPLCRRRRHRLGDARPLLPPQAVELGPQPPLSRGGDVFRTLWWWWAVAAQTGLRGGLYVRGRTASCRSRVVGSGPWLTRTTPIVSPRRPSWRRPVSGVASSN